MPEPFTILGAVSASAGLLAFLVSTTERLVQAAYTVKRARSILTSYLNDFEATNDRIATWERKWLRHDPELLWGQRGAESIRRQSQNVHEILEQSARLVKGETHPHYDWNDSEAAQWTSFLDDVQEQLDTTVVVQPSSGRGRSGGGSHEQDSPNVLKRAALILGKQKLLDDHLKRLRESISNLESRSSTLYNQAHFFPHWDTAHDAQDIEQAQSQRTRAENIERVMRIIFDQLFQEGMMHYTLLMALPDDLRQCSVMASEVLRIDLLHSQTEPYASLECVRLSFQFSPDRDFQRSAQRSIETIKSVQNLIPTRVSEDLKAFLIRMSTDASSSCYAEGTRLLRSKTALSLAFWSAFTWNTGWLDSLCSCGLRMAKDNVKTSSTPSFWKGCEYPASAPCSVGDVKGRNHLLMGVLLAELALLRPVFYVEDTLMGKPFRVRECAGKTVCVSRDELKQRVWDETYSSTYPQAVDYCFYLDDLQVRGGDSRPKHEDMLRLYNERVLQPLIRYYRSIEEDFRTLKIHSSWAERWTFCWQASQA